MKAVTLKSQIVIFVDDTLHKKCDKVVTLNNVLVFVF